MSGRLAGSCGASMQGIVQQQAKSWSDWQAAVVPSLPFQASKTQNPVWALSPARLNSWYDCMCFAVNARFRGTGAALKALPCTSW